MAENLSNPGPIIGDGVYMFRSRLSPAQPASFIKASFPEADAPGFMLIALRRLTNFSLLGI